LLLKELGEEATYYYHPDHLGSVSVVSNHRGEPYERVEYLPFGEIWIEETDPATGYIPFRFTSKELDEETGLYYYGARYYEPATSRWISPDPAGFGLINPMDSDGELRANYSVIEALNWYAYVSNNPVKYVDPTGMREDEDYFADTETSENQYKEGTTSFRYTNLGYLLMEGKGLLGTSNITGSYSIKKEKDDIYSLSVSVNGSTPALGDGETISWFGSVTMDNGENSITQPLSIDESKNRLMSSNTRHIGETKFTLPSSGTVDVTIKTSYIIRAPGGAGAPIGKQRETFNIYP